MFEINYLGAGGGPYEKFVFVVGTYRCFSLLLFTAIKHCKSGLGLCKAESYEANIGSERGRLFHLLNLAFLIGTKKERLNLF